MGWSPTHCTASRPPAVSGTLDRPAPAARCRLSRVQNPPAPVPTVRRHALGRPGRILWTILLCLGLASQVRAQPGGSIEGAITDETGAVLPGVAVTATHAPSGQSRSVVSDARGEYRITRLAPGSYDVEAVLAGFRARTGSTAVTVGEGPSRLDVVLAVAPLAETVTVTRTEQALAGVPQAVTVVNQATLEIAQKRVSLEEALRGVPGLLVQNRRSYTVSGGVGLAIRRPQSRFGIRGLALLQDGVPITTADGTTEPGNVDIGSAGRIEVIRGPSSVLYGNAAGGVINVTTEFSPKRRITFEPDVQFGSYGHNRQQLKVTGREGRTDYLVNVSRFETDGFRGQSDAIIRQGNVVVRRQLSAATELRGVFNYYDSPFAGAPSFLQAADARNRPRAGREIAIAQNWFEATTQAQGGVTLDHQFEAGPRLRATGWGVGRTLEAHGTGQIIDLGRGGGGLRAEALDRVSVGGRPLVWTAGFDLSTQSDDRSESVLVPNRTPGGFSSRGRLLVDQQESIVSLGPFVHAALELHPRWRINGGARVDHYTFTAEDRKLDDGDQSGDRTMSAVSPAIGMTFLAAAGVNVYSALSTAYETPTAQELSNRPEGHGGFNQGLEPEHLTSWEIGVRGLAAAAQLRYELAFYTAQVTNGLVPFERPDGVVFFTNAGEIARNGLELALEWLPHASVSARLAYTYSDFTFDTFVLGASDFSGNVEPGAPPHRIAAGLTHRTRHGLTSIVQLRWDDEYFVNNANTATNWGFTLVDLRVALDRRLGSSGIRPFLGIDNVFNQRYNAWTITNGFGGRYYDPSPGREVYGGVTVDVGVQ
ncbi:MAG: TonB-dependent receptor [Acidimicrobiia bacterium]|nr:TonB-dependent receptor [Acidimicrobiia bacterium]